MHIRRWVSVFFSLPEDDSNKFVVLEDDTCTVAKLVGNKWMCPCECKQLNGVCFWNDIPKKKNIANYSYTSNTLKRNVLRSLVKEYKRVIKNKQDFDGYMAIEKPKIKKAFKLTEDQYNSIFLGFQTLGIIKRKRETVIQDNEYMNVSGIHLKVDLEKADAFL